jgi:hypothetical protein
MLRMLKKKRDLGTGPGVYSILGFILIEEDPS